MTRVRTLSRVAASISPSHNGLKRTVQCFGSTAYTAAEVPGPSAAMGSSSTFYQNRLFERYWSQEPRRVTLRQLCVHGRNITPSKLIASANYVRQELPVRLSHRIRDFQALPFVVGTDPNISRVYELYMNAFESFRKVGEIRNMEENDAFCALLAQQLYWHLEVIPLLAKGMVEAATARHMDAAEVDRFMYTTLRSRIGRRVIAEQHIALTKAYREQLTGKVDDSSPFIGIVNTRTRAGSIVERCAALASKVFKQSYGTIEPPEIIVDGDVDAEFTYIPDQAEYVVYELLENAMRFTLYEHHPEFRHLRQSNHLAAAEAAQRPWGTGAEDTRKLLPLSKLISGPASVSRFEQSLPDRQKAHDVHKHHLHSHTPSTELPPSWQRPDGPHAPEPELVSGSTVKLPAVRVTCALSPTPTSTTPSLTAPGSSGGAFAQTTAVSFSPIIALRISDSGGGIPRPLVPHIFSFAHASKFREFPQVMKKMKGVAGEKEEAETGLAHLGIGLPLSKVYAEFWGGTISVRVVEGWGTDVFVRLGLGNRLENLVE